MAQEFRKVLSFLTPDQVSQLGLPSEAILGEFTDEDLSPERFRTNAVFVAFVHRVISQSGPNSPALQAAARLQGNGFVYIIDLRTPEGPQGRVPPEDVIGAFEVSEGKIIPGSYRANKNHLVVSQSGRMKLPQDLESMLVQEVLLLHQPKSKPAAATEQELGS